MAIIGFVNQKGGPGKTTLALAFAAECARSGKKTLLIDADPMQSLIGWSQDREPSLPENLSIVSMPSKTIHRDVNRLALGGWDIIIIDGPARATDITQSILLASDVVIVPCSASGLDVKGTDGMLEVIRQAKTYNEKLKYAVVINRKVVGSSIGKDARKSLEGLSGDVVVLPTDIAMRVAFAEAASCGMSVQEMNTDKKAMKEICGLYNDIMELLK